MFENNIRISIIIPTYNRLNSLKKTIASLKIQTIKPFSVVVVDDSNNDKIKNWFKKQKFCFEKKYFFFGGRSLPGARNYGLKWALKQNNSDFILFLDDDVILDKNYLKDMLKLSQNNPKTMCFGALNSLEKRPSFVQKFGRFCKNLFCTNMLFINLYPVDFKQSTTKTQWLGGYNLFVRKKVFENNIYFDDKLKYYSIGEDLNFTYRIYKKFGKDSLMISKIPKIKHLFSSKERLKNKKLIYMNFVHYFYFFYKHKLNNHLLNYFKLIVSLFGNFISLLMADVYHKRNLNNLKLIFMIGAVVYCFKHIGKIKNKDISFFYDEFFEK